MITHSKPLRKNSEDCNREFRSRANFGVVYPVSKVLQYFILEEWGIIPRRSKTERIFNITNLMKRGIYWRGIKYQ